MKAASSAAVVATAEDSSTRVRSPFIGDEPRLRGQVARWSPEARQGPLGLGVVPDDAQDIHAFLELCRDFPTLEWSRRQGATPAQIDRLRQLVGHPLPRLYEGFLEQMGEHSPIPIGRDGSSRVRDLIALYQDDNEQYPPHVVVITVPSIDPATVLVYGSTDAPFVATSDGDDVDPMLSPTFAHHLYRLPWTMAHWPDNTQLSFGDHEATAVAARATEEGFEHLWFSGGRELCLERGPVKLLVTQRGSTAHAVLMSPTPSACERPAQWLSRLDGARRL